ncbi:AMP-binding enzyme [Saccharothrix variisporea]|uniref:AMP-binding enzyme n=1 Tax=Saccharothrix variisporea TaxID=543527 RepID=A0A495X5E0_9PSEU|nr:AMP-binding enzyme [Saccharothrix variisporea]
MRTAARHPEHTAVVTAHGRLTYRDLVRQVERWRDRCASSGLPPGSLVAVPAGDGEALPAAFLGVRAAGLVPLLVDDRQPTRAADVLAAGRPAAVLRVETGEIEPTGAPDGRSLPAGAGYVVFSSGSQGTPKGIVGSAAGLLAFIDWEIGELGLAPGTRVAMLTSPAFDVVYRDLLLPLCSGGELHIAAPAVRTVPAAVLPWLAEHAIEVVHAVPSLSARWLADAPSTTVDSLRHTLFAGEPLYGRHVRRWRRAAPSTRVVNLYGPSETTLAKFGYEVPDECDPGLQPVGKPLPGTAVTFDDIASSGTTDFRQVVITTPDGSLGYLPDTCSDDDLDRLRRADGVTRFRTSDRGRVDDGSNLVIAGRVDSLVKRRGTFVDLARVEAAATALPAVRAACCVQLTTSDVVLVVEGPSPDAAAGLRRPLHAALGSDMPDRVLAVPALPLLPGGKADRRGIEELLNLEVADDGRAP